jgi:cystathionine gamma-synthase
MCLLDLKGEKSVKQPIDPAAGTLAVWAGEEERIKQATQVPVFHSVAFGYHNLDQWLEVALGRQSGHIYSRNTNPTVGVFEEKVRRLEGAEAATSAASGMAVISAALFALLKPGDRVVSVRDTYGGTHQMFTEFLPRFHIQAVLCDTTDPEAIEAEIAAGCQLLYLESPTNPTCKVMDLKRLAGAGHSAGAICIVDNTFATPINQNPLALGADLVLHSATKYLGGHADALGGVICGRRDLVEKIYHFREINGASLDPNAAYLLLRGMKTLHLRVRQQNASALAVARFLEAHPAVARVFYPGLESHPGHGIARRQMRGFGGMLSFMLADNRLEAVGRLLPRLRYAHAAANLGAVETIVGPPATTSHVECSAETRAAMGIPEGLIRYSTGIEETEDLIADLAQALACFEVG